MAQTFKAPTTQRVYDACVVGSQLGGALAGALLARRGYRVLHVDPDGARTTYEDGGYLLPSAPALVISPRLFPSAEAALAELGLATDVQRSLEPCTPDLQLLLPRNRVDLGHDVARRQAELRREWPADAARLEAALVELSQAFDAAAPFLRALPPLPATGFGERRAVSKALRFAASAPGAPGVDLERVAPFRAVEGHPLVSALRIAERYLGFLDGPPSPLATARLLGGLLRGSHRIATGHPGLRESFRRRIAESRGELLGGDGTGAPVERFETSGGKIAAVRLAGSPNAYVARVFVAAASPDAVARMLPEGDRQGPLDTVHARRRLLVLNLVVKKAALPPALGDSVLALRDPAGPDTVDNAVLVQVLPARRDRGKGAAEQVADERVVCAAGFVPADTGEQGDAHLAEVGRRIREVIADAIPFFERHLVRESLPALLAPGGRSGARLLPHPLYEVADEGTLGVTGLPCRSAYKNLVFAGREVVPGLGLEGEFHAAVQAAAAAQDLLGKRDLLR